MSVLIISKAKRNGGTKVDLYGKIYHFKPENAADPESPHVCPIPDEDARAIYRLLAIKEGFELADPDAKLPAKPKAEPGQTMAGDKAGKKEAAPIIIQAADGAEINLSELQPEELRALAKDTFQIAVHHKWNDQTVIAKIIEKTRGE
jgi:hypothetical protein